MILELEVILWPILDFIYSYNFYFNHLCFFQISIAIIILMFTRYLKIFRVDTLLIKAYIVFLSQFFNFKLTCNNSTCISTNCVQYCIENGNMFAEFKFNVIFVISSNNNHCRISNHWILKPTFVVLIQV